jgi:hypothetical protein
MVGVRGGTTESAEDAPATVTLDEIGKVNGILTPAAGYALPPSARSIECRSASRSPLASGRPARAYQ